MLEARDGVTHEVAVLIHDRFGRGVRADGRERTDVRLDLDT